LRPGSNRQNEAKDADNPQKAQPSKVLHESLLKKLDEKPQIKAMAGDRAFAAPPKTTSLQYSENAGKTSPNSNSGEAMGAIN
jgi:hypothetical protein